MSAQKYISEVGLLTIVEYGDQQTFSQKTRSKTEQYGEAIIWDLWKLHGDIQ